MITLTFDTCCILRDSEYKKPYFKQVRKLEELEKKGLVKIFKTDAQDTEIGNFPPRLEKSEQYDEQCGLFVFGHSRFGHGQLASKKDDQNFEDLKERQKGTKNKSDVKDLMTLHTHKKYGNDYLITANIKDYIFDKEDISLINPEKLDVSDLDKCTSEDMLRAYLEDIKE